MSPGPRTLFVTGPGGDGATTVAAATALAAARRGQATLLLSAERPGRLAGLLGAEPPAWPGAGGPAETGNGDGDGSGSGCWVARIDAGRSFSDGVLSLQRQVRPALDAVGAAAFDDDELTELPGADALALFQALRGAHAAGTWDLVVVDLPPVTEALRLLALPEQLRRYLRRLLPPERLTARALRPLLAQLTGVPLPVPGLFDATDRWEAELAAVQHLIDAPGTSVRLVLDPGSARSVAAARAARAGLALQGLAIDAVIANRMLPADAAGPWLAGLAGRQRAALAEFARATHLAEPHELPHLGREAGPAELAELAVPPAPAPHRDEPSLEDRLTGEGILVWRLPLPGAVRADLGLVRRGDELVVTTGPFRRALPLPSALRRCTVSGAALDDGELAVRFAPDPGQWPGA